MEQARRLWSSLPSAASLRMLLARGASMGTPGAPVPKLLLLLLVVLLSASLGCAASLPRRLLASGPGPKLDSGALPRFVDPLPIPEVLDGSNGSALNIGMYKTQHTFHRDLPATTVYAYGTSQASASVPGPTIEAVRNVNTVVNWANFIDDEKHILPVDSTLERAQPPLGGIPTVVHLHGGENAPGYNGHPSAWFTARGDKGPAFASSSYTYFNAQLPTTLWYHDLTIGWTRLNVLAGLLGMYILRDPQGYEKNLTLPSGKYEVPLVIADLGFWTNGSLFYYPAGIDPAHPVWHAFFYGDTVTVNGKIWPYLETERTAYRLRILDASNARYYNLSFVCAAASDYPNFTLPLQGTPVPFTQIGSDGGYLNKPIQHSSLLVAPGERFDVLVDFSAVGESCTDVLLVNNAKVPYPIGITPNNTGYLMKFHLSGPSAAPAPPPALPQTVTPYGMRNINQFRKIDLNLRRGKTGNFTGVFIHNHPWTAPPTERPVYESTEIWELINDTPFSWPIHIQLVQSQIAYRQPFNLTAYAGNLCSLRNASRPSCLLGPVEPPLPEEAGWKDTFKALPGRVTTIIMRWFSNVPSSTFGTLFPFDPSATPGYAWHSTMLEAQDNLMIRGLKVYQRPPGPISNKNETPAVGFGPVEVIFP